MEQEEWIDRFIKHFAMLMPERRDNAGTHTGLAYALNDNKAQPPESQAEKIYEDIMLNESIGEHSEVCNKQ